jgi:integrase
VGLSTILRAHKVRQQEDALKLGQHLPVDAPVFPRSPIEPAAPKQPRGVTKEFVAAAAKLGFAGLRFHDLRHTHATLLLMDGVPLNTVSQRLGHSKPIITLTDYGHVLHGSEDQSVAVAGSLHSKARSE